MRKVFSMLVSALIMNLILPAMSGQSQTFTQELQDKLTAQFVGTKIAADRNDIVTAGSIIVLHKDGLLMYSVATPVPPLSTYKKGKISQGFGSSFGRAFLNDMSTSASGASDIPQRKFVADERFWMTGLVIQHDGILFEFYSDPYDGVRYYGQLKFPFPKGHQPAADEMLQTIAEAITVDPTDLANVSAQTDAPTPEQQALAPIPPPPPPPDALPPQPKTISVGETKEQVVAILGQPQKVVTLGKKEIDYYPDMKVIFVAGKVTDAQ